MSYEIIPTSNFSKELKALAKKYPRIKGDIESLIEDLQKNPQQGESLGKDCFKIRIQITGKNSGKSGGARIITCVKVIKERIYFLSIYDKSNQAMNDDLDTLLRSI